jgi:hypothetical protein
VNLTSSVYSDALLIMIALAVLVAAAVLGALDGLGRVFRRMARICRNRDPRVAAAVQHHPAGGVPKLRQPEQGRPLEPGEQAIFDAIETHFYDDSSLPGAGGEDDR